MKKNNFKILIVLLSMFFMSSVFAITIESKKQEIILDENKGFFEGDVKVQVGDVIVESPRADLDLEPQTKKPSLATFFDKPYAHQTKDNKKQSVCLDIIDFMLSDNVQKSISNFGLFSTILDNVYDEGIIDDIENQLNENMIFLSIKYNINNKDL